ncbi:MAG: hypothetical protein L3K26_08180 [Candidatus Hydrogenedentes bacterium]|nr:hypothetical protein [Candidatus Hydrogenedentota bacterium]
MHADSTVSSNDALSYSFRVQAAISAQGFDWDHVDGVLEKVEEELGEIRAALADKDEEHARRELGDLLLITVNLARFLGADPGTELRRATQRFELRFSRMKKALVADGKSVETCSLNALEGYWQGVKPEVDELLEKGLDMCPDDGANSGSVITETLDSKGQNGPVDNL